MKFLNHIIWGVALFSVLSIYHLWVVRPVIDENRHLHKYLLAGDYAGYEPFVENYRQHIGACNNWIVMLAREHGINFNSPFGEEAKGKFDKYYNRPTREQYVKIRKE